MSNSETHSEESDPIAPIQDQVDRTIRGGGSTLDDLDGRLPARSLPPETLSPTTNTTTKTMRPPQVLVCVDCETYYKHKPTWEHCPQCAAELTEVEKA